MAKIPKDAILKIPNYLIESGDADVVERGTLIYKGRDGIWRKYGEPDDEIRMISIPEEEEEPHA